MGSYGPSRNYVYWFVSVSNLPKFISRASQFSSEWHRAWSVHLTENNQGWQRSTLKVVDGHSEKVGLRADIKCHKINIYLKKL